MTVIQSLYNVMMALMGGGGVKRWVEEKGDSSTITRIHPLSNVKGYLENIRGSVRSNLTT